MTWQKSLSIPDVIDHFDVPGLIWASKFSSDPSEYVTPPPQIFWPSLNYIHSYQ